MRPQNTVLRLKRHLTEQGVQICLFYIGHNAYYAAIVRVAVWVLIIVFPIVLSGQIGYWAILFASLLGMIVLMIFEVGESLLRPFEGAPTDTPMSSIIRTIEINLLEELGESDIPEPVEAVDGQYLM